MEVVFEALIKKIEIKSLVSLDKVARLTIDFSAENADLVDKLNRLMRADETVQIAIVKSG